MDFVEGLRTRISNAPFQSGERRLLKTILGDFQRNKFSTNDAGYSIVRRMLRANEESLKRMRAEDERRDEYLEENQILKSLLE